MNTAYWKSPLGMIEIIEKDNFIIRLDFSQQNKESTDVQSPVLIKTIKQLSEYFNQTRQIFDIPLKPIGTDFQLRVWKELQNIPYGETRSYQDIAQNIHNAKACRAVGMANNRNHIAIIIPCHRVIGKNGALTGYASGLNIKEALLKLEKSFYK
ncbi:MAG: methylated-DNA--[Alphaproteobacteria bacterium]|nr:methylated-DNA--[protein]-cysteine S-methyltransferase [Alphaproteobacteria bacterium]